MKYFKLLIPFTFLLSFQALGSSFYFTQSGDTLEKIIQKVVPWVNESNMDHAKEIIVKANPQIKNFNSLPLQIKVFLPEESLDPRYKFKALTLKKLVKPSKVIENNKEVENERISYRVRSAIDLNHLVEIIYPFSQNESFQKRVITAIRRLNPSLKESDRLRIGSVLRLPHRDFVEKILTENTRGLASISPRIEPRFYTPSRALDKEVASLSGIEARMYIKLLRQTIASKDTDVLLKELRGLIELSQTFHHPQLEYAYRTLVVAILRTKDVDVFKNELVSFLGDWKMARNKHYQE